MSAGAQTVAATRWVRRCTKCWHEFAGIPRRCTRCSGELIAVQLDPDDARPTVAQLRLNLDGQAAMFDTIEEG